VPPQEASLKALRYSPHCQGITQLYLHTLRFICKRSELYLPSSVLKTEEKKRSEEMQTLRDGCSKAEPKIFTPLQTPLTWARDGQNLISWRWSLPLPTDPVWWGSMHAISSYCYCSVCAPL